MVVAGLDLAAYRHRCSGLAVINDRQGALEGLRCLYDDNEIISAVMGFSVEVLAIDAPIAESPRFRDVDREAIRRGFRVIPPTFKHMRVLTERAWRLYRVFKGLGVKVIETHPRSAFKSSGAEDVLSLSNALDIAISKELREKLRHKDLRDALISAIVALCYKRGVCVDVIKASDGEIYVLKPISTLKQYQP